jgi:putative zinc finger protein
MTCAEFQDQIELYAAGECDEPEQAAIRQHLAHCPACLRIEQEAREMLGLLEVHLREKESLQRLQARLRSEEDRPRTVKLLPFARRVAAVAAMLLLAVGLSVWFRSPDPFGTPNPLVLAWGPAPGIRNLPEHVEHHPAIAALKGGQKTQVYDLDLRGKTAKEFSRAIAQAEDHLPEPPLVNLGLELRNTTEHELTVHVGGKGTELMLDLTGPGVITTTTANSFGADFLIPKRITLQRGQIYRLPISRLVYGTPDKIQVAYWSEPGEYQLKVRCKVGLTSTPQGGKMAYVTLRSVPLKIQVNGK